MSFFFVRSTAAQGGGGGSGFAPEATYGYSGTPSIDGSFTVTGPSGSFGSGPNVVLYNDFRNTANGALVANSDPVIGTYNGNSEGTDLIGSSVAYIGTRGANIRDDAFDEGQPERCRTKTVAVSACNEVFYMFALKPRNSYMATAQNTFVDASNSNWKWFWANNGAIDGSTYDVVNVSVNGGTQFAGNSVSPTGEPYNGPDLGSFEYDDWNIMEFWVQHGSPDPKVDSGIGGGWITNNLVSRAGSSGSMVFAPGYGGTVQITKLVMPVAYFGNISDMSNLRPDIGLHYAATGANAAARIFIGNASTIGACTRLWPCTPTSWSDTSITANLRGSIAAGNYIYVMKADNTTLRTVGQFT